MKPFLQAVTLSSVSVKAIIICFFIANELYMPVMIVFFKGAVGKDGESWLLILDVSQIVSIFPNLNHLALIIICYYLLLLCYLSTLVNLLYHRVFLHPSFLTEFPVYIQNQTMIVGYLASYTDVLQGGHAIFPPSETFVAEERLCDKHLHGRFSSLNISSKAWYSGKRFSWLVALL